MRDSLTTTDLPGLTRQQGKVRDLYDLGDRLLLVSTDRISAFDWVLPSGIPDKGRVLTQVSNYWFGQLEMANHLLQTEVEAMDLPETIDPGPLAGRAVMVRKAQVVPFECVVRGYLSGSAWKEYQETGAVCGIKLPEGMVESQQLPTPIFTPATKAAAGDHDQNISFAEMSDAVGQQLAATLREKSLEIYLQGQQHASQVGLLLADTKFEFGHCQGQLLLVDEVMTPDSSRFWPADEYEPGRSQRSFDKQFVRDWLSGSGWDKNSPPPELPVEVVRKTREKYIEACERITGESFPWK